MLQMLQIHSIDFISLYSKIPNVVIIALNYFRNPSISRNFSKIAIKKILFYDSTFISFFIEKKTIEFYLSMKLQFDTSCLKLYFNLVWCKIFDFLSMSQSNVFFFSHESLFYPFNLNLNGFLKKLDMM